MPHSQSTDAEECKKNTAHNYISFFKLFFSPLIYQMQVFHVTLSSEDHGFMIIRKLCMQQLQRIQDEIIVYM